MSQQTGYLSGLTQYPPYNQPSRWLSWNNTATHAPEETTSGTDHLTSTYSNEQLSYDHQASNGPPPMTPHSTVLYQHNDNPGQCGNVKSSMLPPPPGPQVLHSSFPNVAPSQAVPEQQFGHTAGSDSSHRSVGRVDGPRKRVAAACEGCRAGKEKCDGNNPCRRCTSKGIECKRQEILPKEAAFQGRVLESIQELQATANTMLLQLPVMDKRLRNIESHMEESSASQ